MSKLLQKNPISISLLDEISDKSESLQNELNDLVCSYEINNPGQSVILEVEKNKKIIVTLLVDEKSLR